MQIFEKGDMKFEVFAYRDANLKKILIWEAKARGVNSVSSEKQHESEIFTQKDWCVQIPRTRPPGYGPA